MIFFYSFYYNTNTKKKKIILVNRREERMGKALLAGRTEGEKVVGQGGKKGKGFSGREERREKV